MKTNIFFIVLTMLVLSCNSNPTEENDSQTKTLYGNWLWTKTSGGFIGQVITRSVDKKVIHTYSSDGVFTRSRNDTLLISSQFIIKKQKSMYSPDSLDAIIYQDATLHKQIIILLSKDSLVLGDNMFDGYCSIFIRGNK